MVSMILSPLELLRTLLATWAGALGEASDFEVAIQIKISL